MCAVCIRQHAHYAHPVRPPSPETDESEGYYPGDESPSRDYEEGWAASASLNPAYGLNLIAEPGGTWAELPPPSMAQHPGSTLGGGYSPPSSEPARLMS